MKKYGTHQKGPDSLQRITTLQLHPHGSLSDPMGCSAVSRIVSAHSIRRESWKQGVREQSPPARFQPECAHPYQAHPPSRPPHGCP